MDEFIIITKAIKYIYELIDCKDREPDKALIYRKMIVCCITELEDIIETKGYSEKEA